MPAERIYHKTRKGIAELKSSGKELTLLQRRVLILVNGQHDRDEIARLSLCEDVDDILRALALAGFIADGEISSTTVAAQDYAPTR